MACHSDDIPTEISSSLSSPFRTSLVGKRTETVSSQVERLDEADKQILEWAGKLEMESVELREKSSQLVSILQNNSDELCGLVKKLNGVLAKQGDLNEIRSFISELGTHLEEQLKNMERNAETARRPPTPKEVNYGADLKRLEKNIIKSFDLKQKSAAKSFECTQNLLFSVGKQLEDTHQVIVSMSRDINTINFKQASLEVRLKQCECATNCNLNKSRDGANDTNLHGTTLSGDTSEENTSNDGPITRSMSKRKKKDPECIPSNKIAKRRNLGMTRTIIPWEEVDRYYSSEL